jgi:hypothetical protein
MTYDSDSDREHTYDRWEHRDRSRRHKPPMTAATVLANLPTRDTIFQKAERIIGNWRFLQAINFGGEEDELLAKLEILEWQLAIIDFFDATTGTPDSLIVYREALGYAIVYGIQEKCIDILDRYTRGSLTRNPFGLSDEERERMVMA